MENQDVINNIEHNQIEDTQSQFVSVENTAIVEYFDIVKTEYDIERNKKQSFENRTGLIMALLGAVCIFLFEQVNLKDVLSLMVLPLNFLDMIKILSGLAVYVGFLFTMIMNIKTIIVKPHDNFEVKNINEELLVEQRLIALCRIVKTYRDIIIQHRKLNEERAKTLRKSLYGISITIVAVIIYITLV